MHRSIRVEIFLLIILFLLAGCAGGRNFVRPTHELFNSENTTYSEILNSYGKPLSEGTKIVNDKAVNFIGYSYSSALGEGAWSGNIQDRTIIFYFFENALVGYLFNSSFKDDSSYFDDSQMAKIIKGKTSRSEVIDILGKEFSIFRYPLIKEKENYALIYIYSTQRKKFFGDFERYYNEVSIEFNKENIVTDIQSTEITKK